VKKMTNAEMYKEVFGMDPEINNCPTSKCSKCPCYININCVCNNLNAAAWWNEEYKGNAILRVEVTEVHTFAKPDDVSDLDFPGVSSEDK